MKNLNLEKELNEIYTPLDEARAEIRRRWSDKKLRKKVAAFLKNDIPKIFQDSPRAVLGRQVASPNFEAMHFLELSRSIGLKSLHLEYLNDKFIAENIDKYYLCKLFFCRNNDRNKDGVISTIKAIDFNNAEGKSINALRTVWGGDLVELHHKIVAPLNSTFDADIFDISEYYKRNGPSADKYYTFLLTLFICHGVLFENYLLDKKQIDFTKNIVLPNYKKVSKIFGLKPLIVRLGPIGEEEDLYWRYYPLSIKCEIEKISSH